MPGILSLLSRHAKTVVAAAVAVVVFAETMFPSVRFEHAVTAAIGAYLVWQVPNARAVPATPGTVGPEQLLQLEKLLAARLGLVPGSPPPAPPGEPGKDSTFKAFSSPASSP